MMIKFLKTYGGPLLYLLISVVCIVAIHGSILDSLYDFNPFDGVFLAGGFYWLLLVYKEEQSRQELTRPGSVAAESSSNGIKLIPERRAFIMRNSIAPCIIIVVSIWMNSGNSFADPNFLVMLPLAYGVYMLINAFFKSDKTIYIIGQTGIRIYEKPLFFKLKESTLSFADVEDIYCRQAVYEKTGDRGTIFIYDGDTDSDGGKVYAKLMGIDNYKEIARLIQQRVNEARGMKVQNC